MTAQANIVRITPSMASELLGRNERNRVMSHSRVDGLASAMVRGEWAFNGDAIRVGADGVLLDGQHRLAAVVKAGIPIDAVLITGLPPEVFETIDRGAKRSSADDIHLAGITNSTSVAAGAFLLVKYRAYGSPFFGSMNPSATQILDCARKEPGLEVNAKWCQGKGKWCKKYLGPALTVFCRTVFIEKHGKDAESFFELLESGAGLEQGSPILALRERLVDAFSHKTRMAKTYKCALTFKAFRLFLDGATIKQLQVRKDGSSADPSFFTL